MPAPTYNSLLALLTQAALSQGFKKQSYDSNGNIAVSQTQVPDAMNNLLIVQAKAISQQWSTWQSSQTVVVQVTDPPQTAVGSPGLALP